MPHCVADCNDSSAARETASPSFTRSDCRLASLSRLHTSLVQLRYHTSLACRLLRLKQRLGKARLADDALQGASSEGIVEGHWNGGSRSFRLQLQMRWLPRWRTATNPCCSRILQTSAPERTRSLPNGHLNLSYENLVVQPPSNLGWRGCLEKERQGFDQIGASLLHRSALTGNVEFGAQCHEIIVFTLNNGRQSVGCGYTGIVPHTTIRPAARAPRRCAACARCGARAPAGCSGANPGPGGASRARRQRR